MKRLSIILLTMILLLSFTACSLGRDSAKNPEKSGFVGDKENDKADGDHEKDAAKNDEDEAVDDAMREAGKILNPDRTKWPKEIMHPDMPEFTKGKMNAWAPWEASNDYNIFMLIVDVSVKDVEEYEKELEAAGFTGGSSRVASDNESRFHKDLYDVELKMNSDTILEISSYKTETVEWPKALSDIPPVKAGNLTYAYGANEEQPDSIQLYYINLTPEELTKWRQELVKNGFVESDCYDNYGSLNAENKKINVKTFATVNISYEDNGTNEWNIDIGFEK